MASDNTAKGKKAPKPKATTPKRAKRTQAERLEIIAGKAPILNRNGKKVRGKVAAYLRTKMLQGMTTEQAIWHLHVNEGMTLVEIAHKLAMGPDAVKIAFRRIIEAIADEAPKTEKDFIKMREEVGARLLATYQDACGPIKKMDPRFLLVRLNTLKAYSTLYGLNLEKESKDDGMTPYATPDEIAAEVSKRQLAQFGRVRDVEAARVALAQTTERDVTPGAE